MRISPRSGKPHNQLAIVALQAGRTLEAVYYYARALLVRHPILTARDSLTGLFERVCVAAVSYAFMASVGILGCRVGI